MSGNPEQPPVPGKTQETYYPPPPPGGPAQSDPQQIYEAPNSDLPPAYNTGPQQQAPPEKAPLPQQQTTAGEQSFPPPPPGPPPTQQQQYAPSQADSHEANAFYKGSNQYEEKPPVPGPRPTGAGVGVGTAPGAAAAGAIPSYDPAHPQFAPPPGQQQQQHVDQSYNQTPVGGSAYPSAGGAYPAGGSTHPAGAAAHGTTAHGTHGQDGHRSWGSLLTEMGHKAAAPINALANKLGSQSFLPTSLDKESEKAANILRSFCKEGISSDAAAVNVNPDEKEKIEGDGALTPTKQKHRKERRAIVKIPSKVINKAQGLAIFTTARMGFNLSGATGSGVLIARLPDGSWSPPSGIQVHALGAGFMIGVDIYDCVCVINSREALAAFMSTRVSLGPDVAVTAGPWGAGGMVDFGGAFQSADERKAAEAQKAQLEQQQKEDHVHEKPALGPDGTPLATDANDGLKPEKPKNKRSSSVSLKPVFTYVKSRGFYAGVQVDGTIITERKDANASFYGHRVSVEQILRGEVQPGGAWSAGVRPLFDALRVAETQQALPDANMPAPPPVGTQPATTAPGLGAQQGPAGQALGSQAPGQQHHMSGAGPSQGGEALPGYQDDGVHRPGVGDHKTQYA